MPHGYEELDDALAALDTFEEDTRETRASIKQRGDALEAAVSRLEPAWSGSYLGYHSRLYYGNFEAPPPNAVFSVEWGGVNGLPPGWRERTLDEIAYFVELQTGESEPGNGATQLWDRAEGSVSRARELHAEVCLALMLISGDPSFTAEQKLLDQLEEHRWGTMPNPNVPSGFMSRDSEAVSQGARLPPHRQYTLKLRYVRSMSESVTEFALKARRLLRQTRRRLELNAKAAADRAAASALETDDALKSVIDLCQRFPVAAQQLTRRRSGRQTLVIEDEYDVQDLLHSLLVLKFEDVRPEESGPSQAGSSPRIDFLLKSEQIVVETKKTRDGLGEKQIGDELAADVARYHAHPDARVLVCLVYDPDRRLANPRGLERDLAELSGDKLLVEAVVAQ